MKTLNNVGVIRGNLTGGLISSRWCQYCGENSGKRLNFDKFRPQSQSRVCDLHQFFKRRAFTGADRHTL